MVHVDCPDVVLIGTSLVFLMHVKVTDSTNCFLAESRETVTRQECTRTGYLSFSYGGSSTEFKTAKPLRSHSIIRFRIIELKETEPDLLVNGENECSAKAASSQGTQYTTVEEVHGKQPSAPTFPQRAGVGPMQPIDPNSHLRPPRCS